MVFYTFYLIYLTFETFMSPCCFSYLGMYEVACSGGITQQNLNMNFTNFHKLRSLSISELTRKLGVSNTNGLIKHHNRFVINIKSQRVRTFSLNEP